MKKIVIGLLCTIVTICVLCVYLVGGQIGAYSWNIAVFIFAPIAIIAILIQIPALIFSLCKKKKVVWNLAFIAISIVFALPVTVLFGISPVSYPTNAKQDDAVTVTMPVENAELFGGKEYKSHAMWPSECYAYDILKEPYDIGSNNLNDYGIFGCDVHSPVSGTVIGTIKDEPDIAPNIEEFLSSLGNYIYIKIDDTDTYLILSHFKENSISVNVGDHVDENQLIGKVGNSGTTSEPHLHIQHQRNNPLNVKFSSCAEGLPIYFK